MAHFVTVIAVVAFLSGAATAVFVMLVVGIRRAGHPRLPRSRRDTSIDAFARVTFASGSWPNRPIVGDSEPE